MTGFGIVGCGAIAQAHIESILEIPDAKLVAVWNRTPDKAEETAAEYGCDWTGDLDDLLQNPEIDVVNICTASGAHLEPALAAAAAGKHIIVEKPLEITPERCDQIIEACEEAGVKLATIFQSRTRKGPVQIREAIEAGRFGELVMGTAHIPWYRSQEYYDSGGWRGTWDLDGGGALMNQGIHQVDLLQWFMGPVREIQAFADCLAHERIEVEDTALAVLRFESGALGLILAATSLNPGYPVRIEVFGKEGGTVMVDGQIVEWHTVDGESRSLGLAPRGRGAAANPMDISFDPHRRQIEDMLAAIRDDRAPVVDGHEGRKSVEIIHGVYEAAGLR